MIRRDVVYMKKFLVFIFCLSFMPLAARAQEQAACPACPTAQEVDDLKKENRRLDDELYKILSGDFSDNKAATEKRVTEVKRDMQAEMDMLKKKSDELTRELKAKEADMSKL